MAWYEELEPQVFCMEVLLCAKGDREAYTTYGYAAFPGTTP
jgi:hypothetical protein